MHRRGLTLIELMVIIIIIAVLAATLFPTSGRTHPQNHPVLQLSLLLRAKVVVHLRIDRGIISHPN